MKKLLIANRGEIAVRIIRAAQELNIETVLAVSEADRDSVAARLSDDIVVIGPSAAMKSYLSRDAVLSAAASSGADAVHPGYGFLSEDAEFAEAVASAGLIWVGPDASSIRLMGNKAAARDAAAKAGVPIMTGSNGVIGSSEELQRMAADIGFPLLIKASAGGGGRGIRIVRAASDLEAEFAVATAESLAAFGDSAVYLEKYVEKARHVEVQILGDGVDAIHLFDRDCSMQRRQQKVVEEAPAVGLPPDVREQMLTSAVQLAEVCNYRGAGTVEFLYDVDSGAVCFIEMNTRLQVEHPVTEMITGLDLVREQLRIARGEKLGYQQDSIRTQGHAIEMRINAEDPTKQFMPSPGTIGTLVWPGGPGVRVDSGFAPGSVVPPFYDSMLAKIIVWDNDRATAIRRAERALKELQVEGISTTRDFLLNLVAHPAFADLTHHTKFIEQSIM